jgi:hypothetical protein
VDLLLGAPFLVRISTFFIMATRFTGSKLHELRVRQLSGKPVEEKRVREEKKGSVLGYWYSIILRNQPVQHNRILSFSFQIPQRAGAAGFRRR